MSSEDEIGKTAVTAPNGSPLGVEKDIEITLVRQPSYGMPEIGVIAEQAGFQIWMGQMLLQILDEVKTIHHAKKVPSGDGDTPTPANGWLETEQAAAYLNLTVKAIREGAVRGTLPGHKYPANSRRGRWRFKKEELDAALNRKPRRFASKGVTAW